MSSFLSFSWSVGAMLNDFVVVVVVVVVTTRPRIMLLATKTMKEVMPEAPSSRTPLKI